MDQKCEHSYSLSKMSKKVKRKIMINHYLLIHTAALPASNPYETCRISKFGQIMDQKYENSYALSKKVKRKIMINHF